MLQYVGQPQILYIAGIIPLNVETAVDVSIKLGPFDNSLCLLNKIVMILIFLSVRP